MQTVEAHLLRHQRLARALLGTGLEAMHLIMLLCLHSVPVLRIGENLNSGVTKLFAGEKSQPRAAFMLEYSYGSHPGPSQGADQWSGMILTMPSLLGNIRSERGFELTDTGRQDQGSGNRQDICVITENAVLHAGGQGRS